MLESVCSPLEIVDGYIGSISVSVPWTALLNDSCCLDIQGLELTLAPKRKSTDTGQICCRLAQLVLPSSSNFTLMHINSTSDSIMIHQLRHWFETATTAGHIVALTCG